MGTIFKIALRNLVQHRNKTIIIGVIIVIAIALGLVGNTALNSAQQSLRKTFTQNFTGDILIVPKEIQGGIFGASGDDNSNGPPIIPMMKDYEKVFGSIKDKKEIASLTSQISAYVIFNLQDAGINFGLTFGVDADDYFKTFDNVVVLQGRKLRSGEEGIMLHEKIVKTMKKDNDVDLKIGDKVQLNNFGESGFKIREIPIVGIFKFKAGNERSFEFMQPNLVDISTLRALKGTTILTKEDLQVDDATQKALDSNGDDFFSESTTVKAPQASSSAKVDLNKLLGERSNRTDTASSQRGAWNYILIKIKPGVDEDQFIKDLNAQFERDKLEVKAQNWFISAQPDSGVFMAMSLIFNIIVWVLAIVSIIIIMNTLVVSVMERTPEIGTMRALGASKGVVCTLFIMETLIVSFGSGLVGVIIGFAVVGLLNWVGIPAPNDFMRLIFGGDLLRPEIALGPTIIAVLIIFIIALVSWIVPVFMALKVSPLKAITAE